MKSLLIIGAGGHGKVLLDIAVCMNAFDEIAFQDSNPAINEVLGYSVYHEAVNNPILTRRFTHAIVAIGNNDIRMKCLREVEDAGYIIDILIHPTAVVSRFATVAVGSVIMPLAVIAPNVYIGKGCIINTSAVVEHDCVLEEGVHLSPNVILGGAVRIGKRCWIGIGAKAINNIKIGGDVIIGASGLVIRDIISSGTYIGVPVKKYK